MNKVYDLELVRNMKKLIVQLDKPLITSYDYDDLIRSMEMVFGKVDETMGELR